MGFLDNLTNMVGGGGGEGQQGEGAMGILGSLLQQGGGEGQSSQGGQGGGLQQTLETLAANGLSEHVGSWLSNNPNLPISADQLRDALGSEQVQSMASASGLPIGDFLQHLAQHLPQAASEAAGTDDNS